MRKPVDLRSDTVTRPSPEMREAMANAEVGDDVCGDDPTIRRLEERGAELMGMEAALFVPSGTMGNQIALFAQARRGDEVICGRPCHIQEHEVGAAAVLASVTLVPIDSPLGELAPEAIEEHVREEDIHHPRTGLLCLECAHSSGSVPGLDCLTDAAAVARRHNLPVHLDGARIFNAAFALDVEPCEIAGVADTVMFSLSKGLGAPVGSLICGSESFVARARKIRKLLGGGMRQVGVLGGAGLYALEHNVDRLTEDHQRARSLASMLSEIPAVKVLTERLDINMVWFDLEGEGWSPAKIVSELEQRGVLVYPPLDSKWRLVCHMDVDDDAMSYASRQLAEVLSSR